MTLMQGSRSGAVCQVSAGVVPAGRLGAQGHLPRPDQAPACTRLPAPGKGVSLAFSRGIHSLEQLHHLTAKVPTTTGSACVLSCSHI